VPVPDSRLSQVAPMIENPWKFHRSIHQVPIWQQWAPRG